MLNVRPWLRLVVAGALSASALSASAAGYGAGGSVAVLGQRLSFSVSFRLDAGETLTPACVNAEVQFGDRRLPASQVTTALEMQTPELARIRVQTEKAVDEPVVDVVLNAGCATPQTRRFVVFADPPRSTTAAALSAPAAALPTAGPEGLAAPQVAGASVSAPDPRAGSSAGGPGSAIRNADRRLAASGSGAAVQRQRSVARRVTVRRQVDAAERQRNVQSGRSTRTVVATTVVPAPAAAPTPRLELDFAEPSGGQPDAIDAALAAVSAAASATRAANAAAAAASGRIAALEQDVERMRSDARNSQLVAAQWQSRLAAAERASRWLLPLLLLVLVLAALAAWLAWRLANAERRRQAPWRDLAAEMAPTAGGNRSELTTPTPFVTSAARRGADSPVPARAAPAWPPPAPPESLPAPDERDTVSLNAGRSPAPVMAFLPDADTDAGRAVSISERTLPYPANTTVSQADESASRDLSIEELIDLEQQAEFFVVLGQDEAAIDLLVDHVRQSGGSSPLPYLKLLEIYFRRGEREEYERTRMRFNHRFNAFAPEWDVGLHSGRSLEDYPGVVPRLQQVWQRPLDAMAELEALLFRKSRGEFFDLPAYREVLFLYSLARDLLDRESAESGDVDLLLPMADGTEFGSTAPAPFLALESEDEIERAGLQTLPMAPVDVDLSAEPTRPSSIFDELHDAPTKP